jgi:hypothetical protein
VNVELWHVLEEVDGAHNSTAITLWDLGLAIATIVVTFLATRNISGLLHNSDLILYDDKQPYGDYDKSERLMFPANAAAARIPHPKQVVYGVRLADTVLRDIEHSLPD